MRWPDDEAAIGTRAPASNEESTAATAKECAAETGANPPGNVCSNSEFKKAKGSATAKATTNKSRVGHILKASCEPDEQRTEDSRGPGKQRTGQAKDRSETMEKTGPNKGVERQGNANDSNANK